jgi:hypothetical protein
MNISKRFRLIFITTLTFVPYVFSQDQWMQRNPFPTGELLVGACWTGSQLVIAGGNGTILTSSDGQIYTSAPAADSSKKVKKSFGPAINWPY